MLPASRSVAQPDSPVRVQGDYTRPEDWLEDPRPAPSLAQGDDLGDYGEDERGHRVNVHGHAAAGRDVYQTGVDQSRNYSLIFNFSRERAAVRNVREGQPLRELARGSLRGTLAEYETTLSDSAGELNLQNLPELDRREIEELLRNSRGTIAELSSRTTEFEGYSRLRQQQWLEEQDGKERFEALRIQVDNFNKDLRDLTVSMKSVKATIKKTYIDAKLESSDNSSIVQTADEDLENDVRFEDIIQELLPQGIPEVFIRKHVPEIRHYIRTLRENDNDEEEEVVQSEDPEGIEVAGDIGAALGSEQEGLVTTSPDPRYNPVPTVIEPNNVELHWSERVQIWSLTRTQRGLQVCSFAEANNFLAVKYVVELGADLNVTQQNGLWSPLHWASANGSLEMVAYLLEHGAKADFADQQRYTALHWAAYYGHSTVATRLLESGAPVDARMSANYTPLHEAVLGGHRDVVEILSRHSADLDLLADKEESPLLCAVEAGNLRTVAYLLSQGVDVDRANDTGVGPLALAASKGYADIVAILLRHNANIDQPDSLGWTPLHFAIQYDRIEAIRLLIARRANCQQPDHAGVRPIHRAAQYGSIDALHVLIGQEHVPVNVRSLNERTPLHNAASSGNVDVLRYLLENGMAQHLEDHDIYDFTPLYLTVDAGHLAAMNFLISRGANVNTRDVYLWTLLHRAAYRGYTRITTELLPRISAEGRAQDNWTPLHEAADKGQFDIVKILVDHNVNLDAQVRTGETAVDIAAASNHQDIAEYLRNAGGRGRLEIVSTSETASRRGRRLANNGSAANLAVRPGFNGPVAVSTTAVAVLGFGMVFFMNSSLRQATLSRLRIMGIGA